MRIYAPSSTPPSAPKPTSVPVVLSLVGPVHRHAEVVGLLFGELGELNADLFQVQTGDFFVELLGKTIDRGFVFVAIGPKIQLGQDLVGEGIGHDEAGMTFG